MVRQGKGIVGEKKTIVRFSLRYSSIMWKM